MNTIKQIVVLTLIIGLAAVVFQNQSHWQVRFLWKSVDLPGFIVLFLTAVAGFIVGSMLR